MSDPKLEPALNLRLDFMLFAGLDLYGTVSDETSPCRFGNTLFKAGVYDVFLAEARPQIENHRLNVKEANESSSAVLSACLANSKVGSAWQHTMIDVRTRSSQ